MFIIIALSEQKNSGNGLSSETLQTKQDSRSVDEMGGWMDRGMGRKIHD